MALVFLALYGHHRWGEQPSIRLSLTELPDELISGLCPGGGHGSGIGASEADL